ncbi:MAG: hypothetical protein C4307_03805, partial [Chloroflexota bacterium]
MRGDEVQEEPVEEGGRVVVESGEPGRVEGSARSQPADLGEEWPTGEDEGGDRLAEAPTVVGQPPCHPVAACRGDALTLPSLLGTPIEGGNKGGDELLAVG